MVMMQHTHSIC